VAYDETVANGVFNFRKIDGNDLVPLLLPDGFED
jgi:hypothetical protein